MHTDVQPNMPTSKTLLCISFYHTLTDQLKYSAFSYTNSILLASACFFFQCILHHNIFWDFSVGLWITLTAISPVFCAFCDILFRIFHQDKPSNISDTSPDVKKANFFPRIQGHGTLHNHTLTFNSTPTHESYGHYTTFNNHVNLQ